MSYRDNRKQMAYPVSASNANAKRSRQDILVVQCPPDFPALPRATSQSPSDPGRNEETGFKFSRKPRQGQILDWSQTAREIHSFGATGFEGKRKREYEDEQYERLTGRRKKHHKVPLPIIRGIKKKREQREQRRNEEAREAGLILPAATRTKQRKRDRTSEIHGPAPSIGFLQKGVLRVKDKPK